MSAAMAVLVNGAVERQNFIARYFIVEAQEQLP
jgi:hypothetical protein